MYVVLIAMLVLYLATLVLALFLGAELLKRFHYMNDFVRSSNQLVTWNYPGAEEGRKPGMRKIVLRGRRPFYVLIGYKLSIPVLEFSGFDYYGITGSDDNGVAVISTYLGRGKCEFLLYVNSDRSVNPIAVSSTDDDQELLSFATYPAKWYQKLGFYG